MVPTLVPGPPLVVADGAEGNELPDVAAELEGVAALPVWASAEIANVTAMARRTRRNLLVIGSIELLGTWFRE
ncbi:MAG TPA: hypothetical protein VF742_15095 [Terracidiphilus sp.]